MEGVEGKISPGLEVVRKYLRKFRLYPGEIKMKKFCVLFVGIVILAIAGISAYGTEEKPVESELGSYARGEGRDRCLLCQRGDNLRRICGKFARSSAQSVGKGETERGDCGGILSIPWSHL